MLLFPPVMSEEESRPAQPPATAGKGTWPGLPEAELRALWKVTCPQGDGAESKMRILAPWMDSEGCGLTEEISTPKSTAAHEAVVRERDKAFQVGGANFVPLLVHFVCVASYVLLLYNTYCSLILRLQLLGDGVVWMSNKVTFGSSFGIKPNYLGGSSGYFDLLWGILNV